MSWHGFGSLIGSKSTSSVLLDNGISKDINLTHESRLGLNVTAPISSDLYAGGQLLAEGRQDNYTLMLEWGFLRWEPISRFYIRAGKTKYPIWLISDQIDVGALYPWIRPPLEVYSLNPVSSISGVTFGYSVPIQNNLLLLLELYGGMTALDIDGGSTRISGSITEAVGVNASLKANGYGKLRLGYSQGRVNLQFNSTQQLTIDAADFDPDDGFQAPTLVEIDAVVPIELGVTRFFSAGLELKALGFFLYSEYALRYAESNILKRADGYYATLGYQYGKLAPHITYSRGSEPETTVAQFSGGQESICLGINYSPNDSMVFKLDFTRSKAMNGPANFVSDPGAPVYVSSVGLDFMF